jgi:hypothetical protein
MGRWREGEIDRGIYGQIKTAGLGCPYLHSPKKGWFLIRR